MRIPNHYEQNDLILATLGRFMMGEWGQMVENIGCLVRTGTVVSDPATRIHMSQLLKEDPYRQRLQDVLDAERPAEEGPVTEENAGEFSVMDFYPEYSAVYVAQEDSSGEFNRMLDYDVCSALSEGRTLDRKDPLFKAFLIGGLRGMNMNYDYAVRKPKDPLGPDPGRGPGAAA